MGNLLSKPANELTKQERDYIKNELNEIDKDEIRKELEIIRHNQEQDKARISSIEEEQEKHHEAIKKLEEGTNVLCAPSHTKRKKVFNNICKRRVWSLFDNDKESAEYIVFSPYLFKKIYSDIALEFNVGSWHDIDMKDYEKPDSVFNQAISYAKQWLPADYYIRQCIKELETKRDSGFLAPERCRALTYYLKETSNGEINIFS